MYLVDNPVLQRELLINLRMPRAFALLLAYQTLLGAVVYFAWPQDARLDLTTNPDDARRLVDMFFLGQYVLASLMAPSFAAGAITGEKERQTYEMLLASPLRPAAIVLGKLLASLAHLGVLVFTSLPIVMLCLPLGGVSFYEVLAAYLGLITSVVAFGMISVACSSYFKRTVAALVCSYLLILPLVLAAVLLWASLADYGQFRLLLAAVVLPACALVLCGLLFVHTSIRLLHPPDVGSEGHDVVDLDREAEEAVGLVIQRDQFPDWLFAPPKRDDLLADGANPVYDKETRSEIFSQGTLMLRVVIQVSMLLAIPLMAVCLYIRPEYAPWYVGYVLVFNMLVGPVYSAGSVTSERERQTLDLLLTTIISPWTILWGKLLAGLRVSSVLTLFLLWPALLASVMVAFYWPNLLAVAAYVAAVLLTCLSTSIIALFWSVMSRKTSVSLMACYVTLLTLFGVPLLVQFFAETFYAPRSDWEAVERIRQLDRGGQDRQQIATRLNDEFARPEQPWTAEEVEQVVGRARVIASVRWLGAASPFSAVFSVPLRDDWLPRESRLADAADDWRLFGAYAAFTVLLNGLLLALMVWLFNVRWRVAD